MLLILNIDHDKRPKEFGHALSTVKDQSPLDNHHIDCYLNRERLKVLTVSMRAYMCVCVCVCVCVCDQSSLASI